MTTYRHGEDDGGIVLCRDTVQCLQVAQLKIIIITSNVSNMLLSKMMGINMMLSNMMVSDMMVINMIVSNMLLSNMNHIIL